MSTDRNTPSQSSTAIGERLVEAVVQPARTDLGHLERPHPLLGHPVQRLRARASSRAARSAGTGRRAPHPTRSAGASAGRARRASRTRCRRCRRARRSARRDTRPSPCCRATPVTSASVIEWSPPSTTGIAPLVATVATASVSAASDRSMSPGGISTSPASSTRRSRSASTRSARCGRDPSCGEVVGGPDRLRAEPGARPVRRAAVERRADRPRRRRRRRSPGRPGRSGPPRGT